MYLPSSNVRCHGCNYQGIMQPRSVKLRYTLPSGDTVDSHRVFGWCETCDGIRDIEGKLDADGIRRDISERRMKTTALGGIFKRAVNRVLGGRTDDMQAELHHLECLLRLAQLRCSPPRCLTCGGTLVTQLKFDDEGISSNYLHTCGGRLYRVPLDPDAPRFSYHPEIVLLDIEGWRMQVYFNEQL